MRSLTLLCYGIAILLRLLQVQPLARADGQPGAASDAEPALRPLQGGLGRRLPHGHGKPGRKQLIVIARECLIAPKEGLHRNYTMAVLKY